MSEAERSYADFYWIFPVLAKLRHALKVLVPRDLKECLDLVKEQRTLVGVSPSNPYLFGTPNMVANTFNYFRASAVLSHIVSQSKVEFPNRIKATELRKQAATFAAKEQLSDFEIAEIARFLGHSERVHLNIYRQPLIVRDVVHMSKFLERALGEHKTSKQQKKQAKTSQRSVEESESCHSQQMHASDEELPPVELPEISGDGTNNIASVALGKHNFFNDQ